MMSRRLLAGDSMSTPDFLFTRKCLDEFFSGKQKTVSLRDGEVFVVGKKEKKNGKT